MDQRLLHRVKLAAAAAARPVALGKVVKIEGLLVGASLQKARVGDGIEILCDDGPRLGAVVGFDGEIALVMPMADVAGIAPGARVRAIGEPLSIPVSDGLLGRVIDPFGRPIDGKGPIIAAARAPVDVPGPLIVERTAVTRRFDTGVRVIDGVLTCGRGQRVGIFAGAGVGKTMLMRSILNHAEADVTVVGLIGERGVEVADLIGDDLGPRGVLVVATSDRSPLERTRGAQAATAVAEHFRDQGKNVLLIIDSLTRYCMALREIGLSAGEPPATKGYPPSVFAALPRLLERVAPMKHGGAITAFYTVLVEGDDLSDPVADSARSLLDGHIVLSRDLAARGHFPAVDVLSSASRVAHKVQTKEARQIAQEVRSVLAARKDVEELRSLGAYVPGASPEADRALAIGHRLDAWSRQDTHDNTPYEKALAGVVEALKAPTPAPAAQGRR
jgi:flagellum-specific ATP synthase